MSAGSINKTVNQAFAAFALLFAFGGIYLGTILYLYAPDPYDAGSLSMRPSLQR